MENRRVRGSSLRLRACVYSAHTHISIYREEGRAREGTDRRVVGRNERGSCHANIVRLEAAHTHTQTDTRCSRMLYGEGNGEGGREWEALTLLQVPLRGRVGREPA